MSPTPPPSYPPLPHSNSLTELCFLSKPLPTSSSSEPIRTCRIKIRPSEDSNAKALIFNAPAPWTKAELQATKIFLEVELRIPHIFPEEFNVAVQTYRPGFSDLYHGAHMFAGESHAQDWMKTARWESPEKSLVLQMKAQPPALI